MNPYTSNCEGFQSTLRGINQFFIPDNLQESLADFLLSPVEMWTIGILCLVVLLFLGFFFLYVGRPEPSYVQMPFFGFISRPATAIVFIVMLVFIYYVLAAVLYTVWLLLRYAIYLLVGAVIAKWIGIAIGIVLIGLIAIEGYYRWQWNNT